MTYRGGGGGKGEGEGKRVKLEVMDLSSNIVALEKKRLSVMMHKKGGRGRCRFVILALSIAMSVSLLESNLKSRGSSTTL